MDTSFLLLIFILINYAQGSQEARECLYMARSVGHISMQNVQEDPTSEDYQAGDIQGLPGEQTEKCSGATKFCYALWHEDSSSNGTGVVIMGQGCWEASGKQDCERSQCIAVHKPSRALNNTKFCCCSGNRCNRNVTVMHDAIDDEADAVPPATEYLEFPTSERQTVIISLACLGTALFAAAVVIAAVWRIWRSSGAALAAGKQSPDSVHLMEHQPPGLFSGTYTVEHLKLSDIVGQGRYGSVWKGSVGEEEVAVKIFPAHYKVYFYNERDIYCLPFMDNPSLLTYFGSDERVGLDGQTEYLLVLSYASNGCLQDYLRSNAINWSTFCRMSLSVARGLAHLHSDKKKGNKMKPCVTHRDLNSRNILVKSDLSCCICDLGFAMKISGSLYYQNGEKQHAETKSINDVGTLRYMAPEVLEGAVNLRDCESSLKQIDVYALGLVLWELATRCGDLYQPSTETPPPPLYMLPFEAEVGHHPSFEQMQVLVSRHKARPLFPEQWRDWTAVRLVRETIEDCWDQDAEARLTALCVEERLHELPTLWDRSIATIFTTGVSPVNLTQPSLLLGSARNSVTINNTGSTISANVTVNNHLAISTTSSVEAGDSSRLELPHDSARPCSQSSVNYGKDTRESTVSEGTVETMVTMSPSEPIIDPSFKNWNQAAMSRQGTSQASVAARPPQGGPLQAFQGRNPCLERNLMVQASSSEELLCQGNTLVDRSSKQCSSSNGGVTSYSGHPEAQLLVANDYLSIASTVQPTAPQPLPIRSATPIPYVQNAVFGDSSGPYSNMPKQPNTVGNRNENVTTKSPRWRFLKKFHLPWSSRTPTNNSNSAGPSDLNSVKTEAVIPGDEAKSNLLARQPQVMETQVCLVGCKPEAKVASPSRRRPSSLALYSSGSARGSQNSLEEQFQQVFGQKGKSLKDPSSRVKTPGDVPPSVRRKGQPRGKSAARFSLYDDRIMSVDYMQQEALDKQHILSVTFSSDQDVNRHNNSASF